MLNPFRKGGSINAELLGRKLKLAEKILAYNMATDKEEAYLSFIKGMVELSKREERLFAKRLAEMKRMRKTLSE